MVSEKEKRNIRILGILLVSVSLVAFFFGSGRGILVQYPYQVWGLPMVALGAIIVTISYMLPTNESVGKVVNVKDSLVIRRILAILALILIGFVTYLIAKYLLHIELPP